MSVYAPTFLLVTARLAGLVGFAPVLSGAGLTVRMRLFLVLVLAGALSPLIIARDVVTPVEFSSLSALLPLVAKELVLGLLIGFAAALPLIAARMGGTMMGQQMGIGLGALIDPASGDEGDAVARLLWWTALAGFVMVGGHELLLMAVLHSFERLPSSMALSELGISAFLGGLLVSAFELALRVAAPLLALVMLESIVVGFVGRTMPQLNVLSLGFPLRILLGIGVLLVGVTAMGDVIVGGMEDVLWRVAGTEGVRD